MTRDWRNQRSARRFVYAFSLLVVADAVLAVFHAYFFYVSWTDYEKETLLELSLSSTHFLTNTIAIIDILVHLLRFDSDDECAFEPAKSTNAFLFSCIGAYADIVGLSLSKPGSGLRAHGWALFAESVASAAVSVACYRWGTGTLAVCEDPKSKRGLAI